MVASTEFTAGAGLQYPLEKVVASPLFQRWLNKFDEAATLTRVRFLSAHDWQQGTGDKIDMLWLEAEAIDPDGNMAGNCFMLRGPTVDILAVLQDADTGELSVVLVMQFRVPVGQYVLSNPSGRVEAESFNSAALRELAEEVGEKISWDPIVWLNDLTLPGGDNAMLVTPGGSDEDVRFGVVRAIMSGEEIRQLHNRSTGLAAEREHLKLRVYQLGAPPFFGLLASLAEHGRPDGKLITSLSLFGPMRSWFAERWR